MLRKWILQSGLRVFGRRHRVGAALRLLREAESWSADRLRSYQDAQVRALLSHCYVHVPYYRDLMDERGLRPDDFRRVEDLARLPYLSRSVLRDEPHRLRADNYPDGMCRFRSSGGTTGEPITVAVDPRARAFERAAFIRGLDWMGYEFGAPRINLFGGSIGPSDRAGARARFVNWLFNVRSLPGLEVTPDNVDIYVAEIERAEGGALLGYASAVLNLAEAMASREIRGTPLSSVVCTSEFMPPHWRTRIGEIMGAPVMCYYGGGEANSIAYEKLGENGYLVVQEHLVLEVATDDAATFTESGRGEACITTLHNYAMPLIRYRNGDAIELSSPPAGRQRIEQIEGRVADQLLRTDGHPVSSVFLPYLFVKGVFPVLRCQVVQRALDRITVNYEPRPGDTSLDDAAEARLTGIFRKYLGEDLRVDFQPGGFERSPSGKHRMTINKVRPAPVEETAAERGRDQL